MNLIGLLQTMSSQPQLYKGLKIRDHHVSGGQRETIRAKRGKKSKSVNAPESSFSVARSRRCGCRLRRWPKVIATRLLPPALGLWWEERSEMKIVAKMIVVQEERPLISTGVTNSISLPNLFIFWRVDGSVLQFKSVLSL